MFGHFCASLESNLTFKRCPQAKEFRRRHHSNQHFCHPNLVHKYRCAFDAVASHQSVFYRSKFDSHATNLHLIICSTKVNQVFFFVVFGLVSTVVHLVRSVIACCIIHKNLFSCEHAVDIPAGNLRAL